jgi:hypothetical protein
VIQRPAAAIVVVAILVLACSGPAALGTASPRAGVATSAAAATSAATPAATPVPASSPLASPVASAPVAASSGPPAARMSVEGGDPVVGQLGTYTWADGGSDSPWLPGAPIAAADGESLTVTLDGGVGIGNWTARRVAAGAEGGAGAGALAKGASGPVTFDAPAKGSWSVQVTIQFAEDLGTASYYWRLNVK